MSWQRVKRVIDLAIGFDVIHLVEPGTGAEHKIQIDIHHKSCAACGHVFPQNNLGEIDTLEIERQEIAALEASHAHVREYAKRTGGLQHIKKVRQ